MQDDAETQTETAEAEVIGTPVEDVKDLMRQAREMIPVGKFGTEPMTFAQQVDFARDMAKARYSIPQHLQGNVGDCLAIVDMASRANLSPYMVAQKTYVQSGRLNFESQLYHAFLQASGLLKGDLLVEYVGDGEEMICVVTGYLRGDPTPRILRSEPLKDLHPGHSEKDGKRYVRGSPLWDRKPKLQMFYDTSRDWVRMYAPRATLGILTPYEMQEYGPDFARDVTPPGSVGLSHRLQGTLKTEPKTDPVAELDKVQNGAPAEPASQAPEAQESAKPKQGAGRPAKPGKRTTDVPKAKSTTKQPDTASDVSRKTSTPNTVTAVAYPSTVAEYLRYARAWIKDASDMTSMGLRWRDEKSLRNKVGMTADDRKPLEELMAKRYADKK